MLGRVKVTIGGKESNYRLREAMHSVTPGRCISPLVLREWIGASRGWVLIETQSVRIDGTSSIALQMLWYEACSEKVLISMSLRILGGLWVCSKKASKGDFRPILLTHSELILLRPNDKWLFINCFWLKYCFWEKFVFYTRNFHDFPVITVYPIYTINISFRETCAPFGANYF